MQRPWEYPAEGYPPAEDMARDRLDSEDEDEEIPPDEFLETAKAMVPGVARTALFRAWDESRGLGGSKENALEIKIQAALNFVFDDMARSSPQQRPPLFAQAPAPMPPPLPLPAPFNRNPEAVPAPNQLLQPIPRDVKPLPVRRKSPRLASPPPVAGGSGALRKGKKVAFTIDLSDSSEAEGMVVEASVSIKRPAKDTGKDKGKGKARVDMVEVSSDESQTTDGDAVVVEPLQTSAADPSLAKPEVEIPIPKKEPDTTPEEDDALATILAIIPDVLPSHVLSLFRQPLYNSKTGNVIEELLSNNSYPKVEKASGSKGKKREREDDKEKDTSSGRNYLEIKGRQTLGKDYNDAALQQLYADFPTVSQANVAQVFKTESSFYSPAFVALEAAILQTEEQRGWKLMSASSRRRGKGKGREIVCLELETEKNWLSKNLRKIKEEKEKAAEAARLLEQEIASGAFFECGCCYGDSALSQLVMCSVGCQFCSECFRALVNNQIGLRKFVLPCPSVDGCTSTFPEHEAVKWLPATTLSALHKIKQEKEVGLADLEGLAHCPRCPFAMIIENDNERLFHCQAEDCGAVTCRECKKDDHLPKTCAEMDEDKKVDSLNRVAEAMSQAAIRRCPNEKCKEPFIKEEGCNKMTCPSCRTVSCYICGKIVEGYSHFANAGSNATYTEPGASCPLWDDTGRRTFEEVEAARQAAAAVVAQDNPAIGAEDLKKLDLPAPPPPPAHLAHVMNGPIVHHYHHYHHQVGRGPQVNVNVNVDYAAEAARLQAARQQALADAEAAAAATRRMQAQQRLLDQQRQQETAARIAEIQKRTAQRQAEALAERRQKDKEREKKRARLLKKKYSLISAIVLVLSLPFSLAQVTPTTLAHALLPGSSGEITTANLSSVTGQSLKLRTFELTVLTNASHALVTFNVSQPVGKIGWLAVGFGTEMSDSAMAVLWPDDAEKDWIIAHRAAGGHSQPDSNPAVLSDSLGRFTIVPDATSSSRTSTIVSFVRQLALPSNQILFPSSNTKYNDLTPRTRTRIIYAYSSSRPASDLESASIAIHDTRSFGSTSVDLGKVYLSSAPPGPSDSTSTNTSAGTGEPTVEVNLPSEDDGWTRNDKIILAHAGIALVVWLVLSPTAILIGRLGRRRLPHHWFRLHSSIQAFVTLPATAVVIFLGAVAAGRGSIVDGHKVLGYLIFALVVLQAAGGWFAHQKPLTPPPSSRPPIRVAHILLGVVILVLSWVQLSLGFDKKQPRPRTKVLTALYVLCITVVSVLYLGSLALLVVARRREGRTWVAAICGLGQDSASPKQKPWAAAMEDLGRRRTSMDAQRGDTLTRRRDSVTAERSA